MSFVRSYNPIWLFRDLTGNPLDDSYYAFFLTNTLPYVPQAVYQDLNGVFPWSNPIPFNIAGTLPNNLYFNENLVYRIEIRQGNSSSDPLIWLVENYVPSNNGGSTPPVSVEAVSENQITNPEFVDIAFTEITSSTSNLIDLGSGWEFVGTGGGTVTITRTANTGVNDIPTQPAYILNITTAGKTTAELRQRFNNNSGLFQGSSAVSSALAVTLVAQDNLGAGGVPLSVSWVPSAGASTTFDLLAYPASYGVLQTSSAIPLSTNNQNSNIAYVDFLISLPASGNVSLSSIQLVKTNTVQDVAYKQESVERQRDHTWHLYRDSVVMQPKDTILTGWQFGLNPWQYRSKGLTALTAQTSYTADQTIIHQQTAGTNINIGRNTSLHGALSVQAVTANNRFALIQYVDSSTIAQYWGQLLSSLVKARIITTNGTAVRFKMRLIYRVNAPSAISTTEPILSWTGTSDPIFASGWTAITPKNDPVYTFDNSYNTSLGANGFHEYPFDEFSLPAPTSVDEVLGIVLYTIDNMVQTGTADVIYFDSVSLVPNEFAIAANPQTFDQVLRQCQFYYEKSTPLDIIPSVIATFNNARSFKMSTHDTGALLQRESLHLQSFNLTYFQKRAAPTLRFYSPTLTTVDRALVGVYRNNAFATYASGPLLTNPGVLTMSTQYLEVGKSTSSVEMRSLDTTTSQIVVNEPGGTFGDEAILTTQFEADSRLGV